ncbi:ATP-binding protein [Sphingomonas sp.]|uniref:ATP-binding protein n=1 Tax=Sphingomonas sp. TaxID=28214 RepID=UPI002CC1C75D|nr:ATP-binding protein [Sphingomonas sp.]HWK34651.1 ATP-binding protein [Sphingomonas sp.]
MDAPILALTRKRAGAPGLDGVAADNMRQLAQLRWIAVAGQTATILVVHFGMGVPLPMGWMLGAALLLGLANLGASLALPRHRVRTVEIMLALLLDMGTLTFQLYLSGGAGNPFVSLYLLQVVLGAILLPPASAAILATVTALCYGLLTWHYEPLVLPDGLLSESADLFAIGRWISFVLVAALLVRFITRISRNLRAHEAYLADLRQHAAEEEGIVRMGLFASGAAHELGTPLGSLAVILADWRRMPAIAHDPELSIEVAEMQGEVQRCKAIVSDILHSAGQPRSEPLERMEAAAFLADAAEDWAAIHAQVPFAYVDATLGTAAIVVDPALRQAVWNMLDNAAEASPAGVALEAMIEGDMLAIAVSDHGPGFATAALATVGKLYQSTKGPGHGLGLFLATNVARRLGGRLEARNLAGGGAEVRLVLPLAAGNG